MQTIKKHFEAIIFMLGLWFLYYILGISCPFLSITGIPCPTCGVTRALIALVSGDFKTYVDYQPMAVPLVLIVLLGFHLSVMKGNIKNVSVIVICIILVVNMILCIFRVTS